MKLLVRNSNFVTHTAAEPHWMYDASLSPNVKQCCETFYTIQITSVLYRRVEKALACSYLSAVLGSGHGRQELENGLRLGHQRGDGMDDRSELGVGFNS